MSTCSTRRYITRDEFTAVITGGWHHKKAYPFSMEYTVVADGGTFEYSSQRGDDVILYDCAGEKRPVELRKEDGFEAELQYFHSCCVDGSRPNYCPPEDSAAAVKLARLLLEARKRNGEKICMPALKELEIGVMFWAGRDPRETLREVKALGVSCGQLGVPGDMPLEGAAEAWRSASSDEDFTRRHCLLRLYRRKLRRYPYSRNDGWVYPARVREPNASSGPRTSATSRRQSGSRVSRAMLGSFRRTRAIRNTSLFAIWCADLRPCCQHGQTFALETGQEPAEILLEFLKDVDRKNLGINFDPANLIMYGTGDPIQAVEVLHEHLISVHCKDGVWPPKRPERTPRGRETPLGEGEVGMDKFIAKLKQVGYKGTLNVEREIDDPEQKKIDMRKGVDLLKRLRPRLVVLCSRGPRPAGSMHGAHRPFAVSEFAGRVRRHGSDPGRTPLRRARR